MIYYLFNDKDVILIIKTGFKKSLIFYSLSLLKLNDIAIIIYLLNIL